MSIQIPEDKGAKKRAGYWNVSIVLGSIATVLFLIGVNRPGHSDAIWICGGWGTCCFSLVYAFSALSTKNDDRVIFIQQPPRYNPVVQPPVIQQTVIQQAAPQPIEIKAPDMFAKTKDMWAEKARNLELARNWEGAAEAYEKAGMYGEAGKIRQDHLEKSQPMVQIGHVGDTVLNDSVMISDGSSKTCNNCGNNVEVGWNICPSCSTPL